METRSAVCRGNCRRRVVGCVAGAAGASSYGTPLPHPSHVGPTTPSSRTLVDPPLITKSPAPTSVLQPLTTFTSCSATNVFCFWRDTTWAGGIAQWSYSVYRLGLYNYTDCSSNCNQGHSMSSDYNNSYSDKVLTYATTTLYTYMFCEDAGYGTHWIGTTYNDRMESFGWYLDESC